MLRVRGSQIAPERQLPQAGIELIGIDCAAADAQVRRADGAVAEVAAAQDETTLRSPIAGEVAKVLARVGEPERGGIVTSRRWAEFAALGSRR